MIAEKSRGYSIGIISKCTACTQMCDVAVALGLPLTSNKFMFKTSNVYGKYLDHIKLFYRTLNVDDQTFLSFNDFQQLLLNVTNIHSIDSSDLVYGSWYDAYAYCAKRNTSLLTLHPKQYGRLLGLIHSGNHSWLNTHMDDHYFAGLHRADSVSTNYRTWLKSSTAAVANKLYVVIYSKHLVTFSISKTNKGGIRQYSKMIAMDDFDMSTCCYV